MAYFSSSVRNIKNECVDAEASSSSDRPAVAYLNQNIKCLDAEFYEEGDKQQHFHKTPI